MDDEWQLIYLTAEELLPGDRFTFNADEVTVVAVNRDGRSGWVVVDVKTPYESYTLGYSPTYIWRQAAPPLPVSVIIQNLQMIVLNTK